MPSSKDPAINRQKAKEWRLANPERVRASKQLYMRKRRATDLAFVERERARALAQYHRLTDEQKGERLVKQREWTRANPQRYRVYLRRYRVNNPLRTILSQAKMRARRLGLPFDLTRDNIAVPEVCPVLGIKIDFLATGIFNPNSPSIDRLIPALGYVASNCRLISNRANILKRDATLAEIEAVAAYMRRELG